MIGDTFVEDTVRQNFTKTKQELYTKESYEITAYTVNKDTSSFNSVAARVRHALIQAMNESTKSPKLVVIILEDAIIKEVQNNLKDKILYNPDKVYKRLYRENIKWLVREINRADMCYKELLPKKSLWDNFPHYLFIIPTKHKAYNNNVARTTFSSILSEAVQAVGSNFSSMQLKQLWDSQDGNLFLKNQQRFTAEGKQTFWQAVDRTIKFCDSILEKKRNKCIAREYNQMMQRPKGLFPPRGRGSFRFNSERDWNKPPSHVGKAREEDSNSD